MCVYLSQFEAYYYEQINTKQHLQAPRQTIHRISSVAYSSFEIPQRVFRKILSQQKHVAAYMNINTSTIRTEINIK